MLSVVVYARNSPLREALTCVLAEFAEVTSVTDVIPAGHAVESRVVVTPVGDCSPEVCGRLSERGWRVLLLAPIPRDAERSRYFESGATGYLPMTVRQEELRGAVNSAAGAALHS